MGLRTVSMAAIILALSSPSVPQGRYHVGCFRHRRLAEYLILSQTHQAEWVQRAMSQMRASDQSYVIAFAGMPGCQSAEQQ